MFGWDILNERALKKKSENFLSRRQMADSVVITDVDEKLNTSICFYRSHGLHKQEALGQNPES
jgi:hypothetical protein